MDSHQIILLNQQKNYEELTNLVENTATEEVNNLSNDIVEQLSDITNGIQYFTICVHLNFCLHFIS